MGYELQTSNYKLQTTNCLIFARYDTGKTERYEVPAWWTEEVSLTSKTGKIK